jgi:nucleoid-associated protein EbfC
VSDLPDMNELIQQAMAMQEQLAAAHEQARSTTVDGQAGGGLVRVTMTGDGEVTAVRIAPDAVDPDDLTMLEDLVLAALHDATHRARELQAGSLLGGLGDLGDLGDLGGLGDLGALFGGGVIDVETEENLALGGSDDDRDHETDEADEAGR